MSPLMIQSMASAQLAEQREAAARRRLCRQVRARRRPPGRVTAPPNLLIMPAEPTARRSHPILSRLHLPHPA
jgi:hypothetical protein